MEQNQYAAFRTEGFDDYRRVYPLLKELGVEVADMNRVPDGGNPNWNLDLFIVKYDGDIEELRERMIKLIETDRRFIDLHRCHQTLAVGKEPDEEWYLSSKYVSETVKIKNSGTYGIYSEEKFPKVNIGSGEDLDNL